MKQEPKKVFILIEEEYHEITNGEHEHRKHHEDGYAHKHFLFIHGYLMEVGKEDYLHFHRVKRRKKYVDESAAEKGVISLDGLVAGENLIVDYDQDVTEIVAEKMLHESLYKAIDRLPDNERKLIIEHFFLDISQTDLALIYDVDQSTISRRIARITEKIGNFMKI